MATSSTYTIPSSPSPSSGTFSTVYTTGSGGTIVSLNGIGYGELLNSQTGESLCINSMTLQVYEGATYGLDERISQLLTPLKLAKKLAWGTERQKVFAPTVDKDQAMSTLKHLTLGEEAKKFILDGTTRLTLQLLPYATINFQLKYTILTNFVFGYKDLVKEVIDLNNRRLKEEEILSKRGKSFTLK